MITVMTEEEQGSNSTQVCKTPKLEKEQRTLPNSNHLINDRDFQPTCLPVSPRNISPFDLSDRTTELHNKIGPLRRDATMEATPPAQVLYHVRREGIRDFCPTPVEGAKPWKDLVRVQHASLETWAVRLGDIVAVCQGAESEGYAKVSDLRSLGDGRYMVVYTWLYTREEIMAEFQIDNGLPEHLRKNLEKRWPEDAHYHYMFSTNRTVTLWDTAISPASEAVVSRVCYSSVYSTTPSTRWIWSVENPRFHWMKKILNLNVSQTETVHQHR